MGNKPKVEKLTIGGDSYVATVLRVLETDVRGRPTTCVMHHADEELAVEPGQAFLVVYALESAVVGREGPPIPRVVPGAAPGEAVIHWPRKRGGRG